MKFQIVVLPLLFAVFPLAANSSVIRVEKDGSGDFSVIQDAVDAAQDGDTILIGPGRFTETHDFEYYNGAMIQVCITIDKSLNIQGSGRELSFIEPGGLNKQQDDPGGIASRANGLELTLSDISIVNCPGRALLFDQQSYDGRLTMERVDIFNCFSGVFVNGTTGSSISDCEIETIPYSPNGFFGRYVSDLSVADCHFVNGAVGIQGMTDGHNVITGCRFEGSTVGVDLVDCGSTEVTQCQFVDCWRAGIGISGTEGVLIYDVEVVGDGEAGIVVSHSEDLEVRNSVFNVSGLCVVFQSPSPGMIFRDNHILSYPGSFGVWIASNYPGPDLVVDLSNNYWGTIDPEEVAASIYDGNDDPDIHLFVDFLPMADGPVSVERTTLDGIKAMYR